MCAVFNQFVVRILTPSLQPLFFAFVLQGFHLVINETPFGY